MTKTVEQAVAGSSTIQKVKKTARKSSRPTPLKEARKKLRNPCGNPNCRSEIQENDDVIYCPVCRKAFHEHPPYHHVTSCWKRAGGCCNMCQECTENEVEINFVRGGGGVCVDCAYNERCLVCDRRMTRPPPQGSSSDESSDDPDQLEIPDRCRTCGKLMHSLCAREDPHRNQCT